MKLRVVLRAATAAITALLIMTAVALADSVPADGDALTAGNQAFIDLGQATPGQVVTWPVRFNLTCTSLNHVAPGATISLNLSSAGVPLNGAVSATGTTIGPVPADWTPAGQGCPSPAPTLAC